jgi:hypothetical protein
MRKTHHKVRGNAAPAPTTGKVFSGGKIIEPVRDSANPKNVNLLFWDGRKAAIGSKTILDGLTYVPSPIDPSILGALTLPSGIASYGSSRKLLRDISMIIKEYSGLPENSVTAASHWVLSTWFPEVRPTAGLSLIGRNTIAGRQMFGLLHSLCRHPVLLTGVTAAGLRTLPMEWQLTLLIHQQELSVEIQRMLSTAREGIGVIPRGGRLLEFRCGVATSTEFGNANRSGATPSLEIPVIPALHGLPVLDIDTRRKIAADFQPRLLAYRLANFSKVQNAAFDAPELAPSIREIAANLMACTPEDADLQKQVPELLREQDKEARSAAWVDLDVVIIEAILAFVHEAKEHAIYVKKIAEAAEVILVERGEKRELEPRAIGARLRALGLLTEPRDRQGIRLMLTGEVSRRVHELAKIFSVPSVQNGSKRCGLCE